MCMMYSHRQKIIRPFFLGLCVGQSRYCPVVALVPDLPDQHSPHSSWFPEIPPDESQQRGADQGRLLEGAKKEMGDMVRLKGGGEEVRICIVPWRALTGGRQGHAEQPASAGQALWQRREAQLPLEKQTAGPLGRQRSAMDGRRLPQSSATGGDSGGALPQPSCNADSERPDLAARDNSASVVESGTS